MTILERRVKQSEEGDDTSIIEVDESTPFTLYQAGNLSCIKPLGLV